MNFKQALSPGLKSKLTITAFMVWMLSANALAQEQRFVNFSVKDGMPEKYLYTAAQDAQGYMWFGTGTGLYRYDGHQFKAYHSPLDRPGRTVGNILQTLFADSSGNLWLGSLNSLQWYNPASNRFWAPNEARPSVAALCDAYVYSFTPLGRSGMLITTGNNYFFSFSAKDSAFTHWGPLYPPTASKTTLRVIVLGSDMWAVHAEGIYHFSANRQYLGFYAWPVADITNVLYHPQRHELVMTSWGSGLIRFNLSSRQYNSTWAVNKTLTKEILFNASLHPNGQIWVSGYQLFVVDSTGAFVTLYHQQKDNPFNLGVSKMVQLFFDKEQNMWICSHNGLAMMPWQNNQIKQVRMLDRLSKNSVEPVKVIGVPGTKELLIANTSTLGLMHYNMLGDTLTTIANPLEKKVERARIISLVETRDGSIYAGDDVHFFRYQPASRQLLPFPLKDQDGKPITGIGRNVFDNKGNVFIGCINNGFYIWHQPSGKLTHYNKWDIDKAANRADNLCYPTLVDGEQNVWFTSNSGVYQYRQADGQFYHHAYKSTDKNIPVPVASGIAQDRAGHYWITSLSMGLYELYFEKGQEVLRNYNQNSGIGLTADYLNTIKASPYDSSLWISTLTGLIKFDPMGKRVLTGFSQQQGMTDNDGGYTFNILPTGYLAQLYYGNINLIDLAHYRYNTLPPALLFNSIKVLDNEYVYQLPQQDAVLHLPYNENFLQVEFAALGFNNSNLNQYAYQLTGVDKDWVYSGNRNKVSYAGLKPGTYVLKVKAANNDGLWGDVTTLTVIIRPPFYATWWFVLLAILLIGGLIFLWNRRHIAQVKKEEQLKSDFRQQIAETEMKALRAQMNPHFIFNCLNSIQKYILQQDHLAASQYLTRFSRLIRLILDHSNQNQISLSSELELLKLYVEMEQLRFDNRFDFAIELAPGIQAEQIELPSMLIQPYLENAIWHGLLHKTSRGKLCLRFTLVQPKVMEIVVEDDGVGRAMAAELKSKQALKKKSYGMKITEDRIAIINQTQKIRATSIVQDLYDAQGQPTGTQVVLRVPIQLIVNNKPHII